ncbi:MAG: threonylcarbamoyl-AMP synthase [SAR202 cluster bacterium]|nr:threonylcarbamoyl-AMP synthase [SAR202 cluster bacterium]
MKALTTTRRVSGTRSVQARAAAQVLKDGGIVALPTDTLYGLAALATDEAAVRRIFVAKGRPQGMALPVLLAGTRQLDTYAADVPDVARKLAAKFWPGQLTLVVRKASNIPDAVTGGAGTVALRVPDSELVRDIVQRLGAPITGTSANRSGRPGLTTAEAVVKELDGLVDLVLDYGAGEQPGGQASTIVDVTGTPLRVLREGPVPLSEIEECCGEEVVLADGK